MRTGNGPRACLPRGYTRQVLNPADIAPDRVRALLRIDYDQLVATGAFDDARVELLAGMLVTITPQDAAHAVQRLAEVLFGALSGRAIVRVQAPLALLDDSEPAPDVAVVPIAGYSAQRPSRVDLLIEVAGSSRRRNRTVKGPFYARAGVPDDWVLDLKRRTIEVHRDPVGSAFTSITRYAEDAVVRPLRCPALAITIRSVLPSG